MQQCRRKWADRMNSIPKYVVSSTLEDPQWSNTTVLNGDAVKEISELKRKVDGESWSTAAMSSCAH